MKLHHSKLHKIEALFNYNQPAYLPNFIYSALRLAYQTRIVLMEVNSQTNFLLFNSFGKYRISPWDMRNMFFFVFYNKIFYAIVFVYVNVRIMLKYLPLEDG